MTSTYTTNYVNVLDSDLFGFRHVKSLVISFVAVLYDRLGIENLCSNFSWNKLGAPKSSEFFFNQTMTTDFFFSSKAVFFLFFRQFSKVIITIFSFGRSEI